jgi:4-hydroxy-3-methylbut-2-enyl diphosphate reductase
MQAQQRQDPQPLRSEGTPEMQDLFSDADARAAAEAAGKVALGHGRFLYLPRVLGFCGGVIRALRILQQVLRDRTGQRVWLLGEIIHNETVNERVRQAGVRIVPEGNVEAVFSLADPNDIFVIPAFGLPVGVEDRLRAFALEPDAIVDTTCPYVKRIWHFVSDAARAGDTVMIHGKPGHPETRATLSRSLTDHNSVVLIPTVADAERVAQAMVSGDWSAFPAEWLFRPDFIMPGRVALVNQTTMLYSETVCIAGVLREAARRVGGTARASETVCRATQDRQDAAAELCKRGCDLILVLGGFTSSNTNQLYRMACTRAPTYFIRSAADLAPDRIHHFVPGTATATSTADWLGAEHRRIGLLAGASCPAPDIGDVIRRLKLLSGRSDATGD